MWAWAFSIQSTSLGGRFEFPTHEPHTRDGFTTAKQMTNITHPPERKPLLEVFSSGGGTQSCAIAALIIQGKLPKPDFAVIADTGYERSTTWEYQERYVAPSLASVGVELRRIKREEWAANWANGVFSPTSGHLLLPVFSTQTDETGKTSNFCSKAWKEEVVNRYLSKTHGVTRGQFRKWIGFSYDEARRVLKMMDGEEYKAGLIRFPLIHDVTLKRRDSIKLVQEMGWPEPPRSNCYMCPNQGDHEWRDLKDNHPHEFQKAVELEREVRQRDPFAWLHGSCKPLDEVDFTEPDGLFTRPCDSGACFI